MSCSRFESLESRSMLAADFYVDQASDFSITNDTGTTGLSAGDTVTWGAGESAVANLTFGTNAFSTIQSAITAATAGDTINVAPGTFSELVTIGKSLTLLGAQAGVKATGSTRTGGETVIDGTGNSSSYNITVEANDVTIDGFKVEIRNLARDGINTRTGSPVSPATTATRSNITLTNNWIYANLPSRTNQFNGIVFGEHTSNTAQSFSAVISDVTITDNYIDLTSSSSTATPSATSIVGARGIVFTNMFRNGGASLEYTGLLVDDNTVFSTYQTVLQAQLQTKLVGATFTDNTIGNSRSGPSLPTLVGGSVFSRNTIQNINPASDYYSNLAGAYLGVVDSTVSGNTFRNIGGTAGLVLAGGRSADSTYFPASSNSTVSNNSFTYNDQAVSSLAGYTSGVLFEANTVSAAVNVGGWLTGRQAGTTGAQAGTVTLSGNTFVNAGFNASLPAVAVSQESVGTTLNAVNATPNVFSGISLSGSTSTADLFSVADQVADVVDATNLGGVTLKSGNVYVTPASFWAASSTTEANVQRAVSVATAGQTVRVKTGAYAAGAATTTVDNLTVDVPTGVTGFTGLILDATATNGTATLSGAGAARLTGNAGNNSLTGNDGNNTITGGAGSDGIVAGAGIDTIIYSAASDISGDSIDGGQGDDLILFTSTTASETLVLPSATTNIEAAKIADASGATTGTTALSIDASALAAAVALTGNDGNNSLTGGSANDTLAGNAGNDTLDGGAGTDTATFAGNYADYTVSVSGADVIVTRNAGGSTVDTVRNVEKLQFADKAVLLVGAAIGSAYTDLQPAIDNASAGDMILVAAGTYSPISIDVAGVTVKTTENAVIQGADAEGATVRFAANNVRLEGFTIDNQNAADGRAIAPQGFSGGQIVNNTIKNAFRGIQGDFYGRPTNLTITGNTFESTVSYGIAGTEDMSITALSGNTFNTSEEAIGLGAGVSGVTPAGLMANNTFSLSAAGDGDTYGVKDYGDNTIYVKAGDSLQAAINGASVGDTILVAAGTYAPFSIPNISNLTVRSIAGAANTIIQGADADGVTVRFGYVHPYYVPHLEGFTIDNQNADDGAAIVTAGFGGGSFANNTIRNAVRGIRGGGYNWLTITGNTFESTVARGIVGTDYSLIWALSGNTFNTTEEAIGLGIDVSMMGNALDAAVIYNLMAAQTFSGYTGRAVRDYRTDSTYVPVELASDTGIFSFDRLTNTGTLVVTPAVGEILEYSVNNGLTWSDSFTAVEGSNAVMVRRVGSTRADSEPQAFTFTLDTVAPTVTIAATRDGLPADAVKAGETVLLTFTFSEAPVGFTAADIDETYGTISGLSGSGTVYTATFTPDADVEAVDELSIAADAFTDTAGNGNPLSNVVEIDVDTIVPSVVSITSSRSVLKANQTAVITFTLNTPSTTFTAGDVVATGGLLSNFASVGGSQTTYTATFTPTANFSGDGTVRVLAGSFFDLSGNQSTAAVDLSPKIDVQTNGPFVVSITAATNPVRIGSASSVITVTLNKHVAAFSKTHVSVTPGSGSLTDLVRVGSSSSYSTTFTPTPGYVGSVAVSVADDVFKDTADNWNVGGSLATPLVVDLVAPDVTITTSSSTLKANETATITFSFTEPVVGFAANDVTVVGGTLSNFAGSGARYTALFTPRANSTTAGSITVAANRYTDAVGNANNVQQQLSPTITINTVVPTLTISQRLPVLRAGQSTTVTFQIRGTVNTAGPNPSPFELSDISLAPNQGSLSNLTSVGVNRGVHTYTAIYTAPAASFSGPVTLTVPSNSFRVVGNDVNGNAAASLTINVDAQGPATVLSTTAQALKIGQTATIDFTIANETANVVGFEAADISLSSGTISIPPTRVPGTNIYRATYTPAADVEGPVTIALAAGKFTDAAGNANTLANSITIAVDTKAPAAPTVSLVSDNGILATDGITSDARLQATGTETNASVQYWANPGLTTPWTPAAAAQGSNTVYVTQTDAARNLSLATRFDFQYYATGPIVSAINLAAASTGLRAGAFVTLSVRFDRPVYVTGNTISRPFIQIGGFTTGDATRRAVYASGSGTATLVFRYQVQAGDTALNGISYPFSSIVLEGAMIRDAANNAASLSFTLPSRRPVTRINA